MTFARNLLQIKHENGFGIEFNCLDALKEANKTRIEMQVAAADSWQRARSDCEFSKDIRHPYDWSYATDYKGTLIPGANGQTFKVSETEEKIDIEKLKVKDEILFYDDVDLFEDELADHGVAQLSVKLVIIIFI